MVWNLPLITDKLKVNMLLNVNTELERVNGSGLFSSCKLITIGVSQYIDVEIDDFKEGIKRILRIQIVSNGTAFRFASHVTSLSGINPPEKFINRGVAVYPGFTGYSCKPANNRIESMNLLERIIDFLMGVELWGK